MKYLVTSVTFDEHDGNVDSATVRVNPMLRAYRITSTTIERLTATHPMMQTQDGNAPIVYRDDIAPLLEAWEEAKSLKRERT